MRHDHCAGSICSVRLSDSSSSTGAHYFEILVAGGTSPSLLMLGDADIIISSSRGVVRGVSIVTDSEPCFEAYTTEYMAAGSCDEGVFQFD